MLAHGSEFRLEMKRLVDHAEKRHTNGRIRNERASALD